MSTACVIVIGNEILSGRTQDTNLAWLAIHLNQAGVKLKEARVIPDVPEVIIATVNECRAKYEYIFTTGGIGPTHDDITSECIAKAFSRKYVRNPQALKLLTDYYGVDKLNEARLKMCDMPEGATLIPNDISVAPGFIIDNVYVMAGVPKIMQSMFNAIKHTLTGGKPVLSESVSVFLTEGVIAKSLTEIQNRFPEVEIGSYPFAREGGKLGTSLVSRHEDAEKLAQVKAAIIQMIEKYSGEIAPN
jgi:molybdenum cofactor synthesis domain-containing protein